MSDNPASSTPPVIDVPLPIRMQLSHAYFQHLAENSGVDILHIKGYAFAEEVYYPGRSSTDVDILVRPEHLDQLVQSALEDGWEIKAHFETGSIFEHAMTIYHGSWGLADIHRYFPGIGDAQGSAFEALWQHRRIREIAHYPCVLPSLVDSRILTVVHSARSEAQLKPDIDFLRSSLTSAEWDEMRRRLSDVDAELAFAAALGELENFRKHRDYRLWKSVSEETPDHIKWRARFNHAQGLQGKIRVLLSILRVNRDHLAMELGHDPSPQEIREKFFSRFRVWKK